MNEGEVSQVAFLRKCRCLQRSLRWEPLLSPFQLSESSGMIVPESESGGRKHERALRGPFTRHLSIGAFEAVV